MKGFLRFLGLADGGPDGVLYAPPGDASTIVGTGMTMKGEIKGPGSVVMLGAFEGDILLDGTLVVLLVLGGAWFWYSAQQDRAQAVHAEALARAAAARTRQPADTAGAAIPILEAALARAPGAALAGQSAYELGNLRFDAGQYPAARAAYEIAVA